MKLHCPQDIKVVLLIKLDPEIQIQNSSNTSTHELEDLLLKEY